MKKRITVSRRTADVLRGLAGGDDPSAVHNADGTVSFQIGEETLRGLVEMRAPGADLESAIRELLGIKGD